MLTCELKFIEMRIVEYKVWCRNSFSAKVFIIEIFFKCNHLWFFFCSFSFLLLLLTVVVVRAFTTNVVEGVLEVLCSFLAGVK